MSVFKRVEYPAKWIRAGDISVVWIQAQRPRNEAEEIRIAEEFDPDAFDFLTVCETKDGRYHVIDGQTRLGAVRRLWGDLERVPCRVLATKSIQEAARIWRTMNRGHKTPRAIDDFRVAVTAEDAEATAVDAIVRGLGLHVQSTAGEGYVSCVGTLLRVYRKHGADHLKLVLGLIIDIWGKDPAGFISSSVEGFSHFLDDFEAFDRKRLVSKVSKRFTPARLIGAARQRRDVFRGTMPRAVEALLVQEYDHGLRTGARLGEE